MYAARAAATSQGPTRLDGGEALAAVALLHAHVHVALALHHALVGVLLGRVGLVRERICAQSFQKPPLQSNNPRQEAKASVAAPRSRAPPALRRARPAQRGA